MCFNWEGVIAILNSSPLKLVAKFMFLSSSVLATESDVNILLAKMWTVTNRLSIIWKSDLYDKKWDFLTSSSRINTHLCINDIDAKETLRENARWELHKNDSSYIKQILETTPHNTRAVRPFTSSLWNHPSKVNKTCETLLEKQRQMYKRHSPIDSYTQMCQCWSTSKNLPTTALYTHRMQFRRPSRSDGL